MIQAPLFQTITLSKLESHLWEAANILRGSPVDRTDWKSYILPLLFFKRICDVWDEEYAEAVETYGEDFSDEHRFQVLQDCHWTVVRETPANVGTALQNTLRGIKAVNQKHLYSVFGDALWSNKDRLPNNDVRDAFAADYSYLSKLWEALSPDLILQQYETDYRWLSQVYVSVQPTTGAGQLIWHALGTKTVELIHQHVHIEAIHDDLDEIVLDAELLEAVLGTPDPGRKAKEIEIKVARRLRKHLGDPRFRALSERLEALKERHERGQLHSIEFLKQLLNIAAELVNVEKNVPPEEDEDRGKAALGELFEEARTEDTPVVVERIVADIDEIVRHVRFPDWQDTSAGEREVRKALRKTLFKYKLHQDKDLFTRAYGYIKQYY
ncbi:MAG: hypothetical protein GY832_03385 [Chloroflexi bacterium]|nr:hypothetical protein [Chloroflexota bacterium]